MTKRIMASRRNHRFVCSFIAIHSIVKITLLLQVVLCCRNREFVVVFVDAIIISNNNGNNILDRRQFLVHRVGKHAFAGLSSFAIISNTPQIANAALFTDNKNDIASRLEQDILIQQPIMAISSNLNGIDNTCYPDFLEGTWDVTQTLINVQTPLGLKYAGGPNGIEEIAKQSIDESKKRLNEPVRLSLRYVKSSIPHDNNKRKGACTIVEDRIYNTRQRLDNFAGRKVVSSIDYADTNGSNRAAMIAAGGTGYDPLSTTLVRFKAPAVQKTFVTSHGSQYYSDNDSTPTSSVVGSTSENPNKNGNTWYGYESQRSLFALTNESTAPPITTDSELLFMFTTATKNDNKQSDDDAVVVNGKLRIVGYLNPNDKLYFDARNRAVTIQDYTLELIKRTS